MQVPVTFTGSTAWVMDSVEVHDNFGLCCDDGCFRRFISSRVHNYLFRNCRFFNNLPMYGYYYGNGGALLLNGYYQDTRVRISASSIVNFIITKPVITFRDILQIHASGCAGGGSWTWVIKLHWQYEQYRFHQNDDQAGKNTPGQWFKLRLFR